MTVHILRQMTTEQTERIDALLHMLDADAPTLNHHRLQTLLENEAFSLFVAEDETGEIAGMLTLTCCQTLSRSKYWIEDVIVDDRYRGMGAGRALVKAAVEYAGSKEEAPAVYLTSNPSRVSARALYRSEGFEEYETGVFRLPRL